MKKTFLTDKEQNNRLIAIKNLIENEKISLYNIHDLLLIKQHINNYVRNTNHKYGLNLNEYDIISPEIAQMIVINTLGKLNRLREQAFFIRLLGQQKEENKDDHVMKRAQKFAEISNLADKIASDSRAIAKMGIDRNRNNYEIVKEIMYQDNVPNRDYFSIEGTFEWFENRLKYNVELYRSLQNDK